MSLIELMILFEAVECALTDFVLTARQNGYEPPATFYTPTPTVRRRGDEFAQRGPQRLDFLQPRRLFLEAEATAAMAAARGSWQRRRGSTREHRPRARRIVASRDGPSRSSDDPPPLARIRGFAAASMHMVVHLARRNATMRIGRMA